MTTATPPSEPDAGATVFIGLGANLGDARATLRDALIALQPLALPGSFAASSLWDGLRPRNNPTCFIFWMESGSKTQEL